MELRRSSTSHVEVALSRRNLLALLAKADDTHSKHTLTRAPEPVPEGQQHGPHLTVIAEPNDEHYGEREPGLTAYRAVHALLVARDLVKQVAEAGGEALDDAHLYKLGLAAGSLDAVAADIPDPVTLILR